MNFNKDRLIFKKKDIKKKTGMTKGKQHERCPVKSKYTDHLVHRSSRIKNQFVYKTEKEDLILQNVFVDFFYTNGSNMF